ncbi:MAG TPA: helix-turn-helix transcriptional regulator [Candidatus Coproplasma stercorigallinarum]|nr:helix-turn-helix transcriptional regulator [Candidatus Coproplasma stercorigallinarum]
MYGERLRELRCEKGLTQKQLAEKLNISQKSLSKYERESLDLSTELIVRICRYFQVSADYLLGLDDY